LRRETVAGQAHHDDDECDHHPAQHYDHLMLLGLTDGPRAPRDRVQDHHGPHAQAGEAKRPAKNRGQDDGGRVDGDASGKSAQEQEQERRQLAGLAIESALKKLVGGVDPKLEIARNEGD